MNTNTICFINQSEPTQKIIVGDAESAAILTRILATVESGKWVIESSESTAKPALVLAVPSAAPSVAVHEGENRRKEERQAKEFRVILISGTATYRCATCDVSLGGMKLKNAVPAGFSEKECTAYISHHDMRENIEMSCQVITDESGTSRLQFVQPKKPDMEKLSEWMADASV